jgi:GT2 family glycosyltransferase
MWSLIKNRIFGQTVTESVRAILPIIVLYNVPLAESSTYRSLMASMHRCGQTGLKIAVYDNSPIRQVTEAEEQQLFAYRHDASNSGLAVAYNWAVEKTISIGAVWLLLLDQDTVLPSNFFEFSLRDARTYKSDSEVVAIVPTVRSGGNLVSPMRVTRFGLKRLSQPAVGKQNTEIMAINSGALIRCSFLSLIGGFDEAYRLDFLDHWLFAQVCKSGKRVAISDLVIEHDLSVSNYRKNISLERYKSILSSEVLFVREERGFCERVFYPLRLLARSLKQLFVYRKVSIAAHTISVAAKIIVHSVPHLQSLRSSA